MTVEYADMDFRQRLSIKARATAREIVEELDGRDECVSCGSTGYVEVHHIDGDWLNNHPMNLAPVCHRCHKGAHRAEQTADSLQAMRDAWNDLTNTNNND